MKVNNDYGVLIVGCKKHEKIASRFFELTKKHWPEVVDKTVFCTDYSTDYQKEFCKIVVEDGSDNYGERLKKGIGAINQSYVLLLLDDYYFTKKIDNNKFNSLIHDIAENNISYCKLVGLPRTYFKYPRITGAYKINIRTHYGVSLQPSIWKKEEILLALSNFSGQSAWEVESALLSYQKNNWKNCITFNRNYLGFKNGVLRGKLFPYTNALLIKNGIEKLDIDRISVTKYLFFLIKQYLSMYMPFFLRKAIKKVAKKFGKKYYSDN